MKIKQIIKDTGQKLQQITNKALTKKILIKTLTIVLLLGFCLIGLLFDSSITVLANGDPNCSFKKTVGIGDLFRINHFLPVISEECALGPDGKANPLSLARVGDVFINIVGLLSSLVFTLFGFLILIAGGMWIYSGIGGLEWSKRGKSLVGRGIWAMIIVLATYTIINWVMGVLNLSGGISLDSLFGRTVVG